MTASLDREYKGVMAILIVVSLHRKNSAHVVRRRHAIELLGFISHTR